MHTPFEVFSFSNSDRRTKYVVADWTEDEKKYGDIRRKPVAEFPISDRYDDEAQLELANVLAKMLNRRRELQLAIKLEVPNE